MIGWWRAQRFRTKLLLITAVGLALRIYYVLEFKADEFLWGDAYAYYWSGRLLAEGHGFIRPLPWVELGEVVHSPDRPPGYFLFLAAFSFAGLKGVLTQKLISALVGAGSIYLAGRLGLKVAGPKVGIVAALLAAFYPNFWLHDGMLMSETMTIFTVTACLLLAYRYLEAPSWKRAAALGAVGGYATLVHPDSLLVVAIAGVAVTLVAQRGAWLPRLRDVAVIGVLGAAVIAPWSIRNLIQFEEFVPLSTGLDITMAVTNCDETYHGRYRGYWYMDCALRHEPATGRDLSEEALYWRELAFDYMSDHRDELPGVIAARVGRMWGVYRPIQQLSLDEIEGHERLVSQLALGWFYVLTPAAIAGLVVLRRRRVTILPFLAPVITVTISAMLTFGNTRYRASAEITLVIGAAVAFVALWDRWRRRPDEVTDAPPPEEDRTLVDATA